MARRALPGDGERVEKANEMRSGLRLYDTAARAVREFSPLRAGRVSLYLCGATVQAAPHIGHMRSGVNFDIAVRWLRSRGYEVTFCRNVTDIEDKILEVEMITLIRKLVERGHAYAAGGDVFFDVSSYPEYGALSGQRIEHMRPAGDTENAEAKRDPRDFVLWKGAKPGEPAWDTPWGPGRPGWHLECSAMARAYLGETFDIHGGGLDLVFPHHENEIAQSRAAGDGFARYWMHNGLVSTAGEKMSKSLGNSLVITEVLRRVRPAELRYYLGQAHYRSVIEFSPEALAEAAAAYRRIEGFVTRAAELAPSPPGTLQTLPPAFAAALDDDLAVPQALALVHDAVRDGNNALATRDSAAAGLILSSVRGMLGVLGIDPLAEPWNAAVAAGGAAHLRGVVDALVRVALEQRAAARERKDYGAADAIRDRLREAGVLVEDTPHGPRWELKQ